MSQLGDINKKINNIEDGVKALNDLLLKEKERSLALLEALGNIERSCDGRNPTHEVIWHTAYDAIASYKQH